MAIFNSYVSLPEGNLDTLTTQKEHSKTHLKSLAFSEGIQHRIDLLLLRQVQFLTGESSVRNTSLGIFVAECMEQI